MTEFGVEKASSGEKRSHENFVRGNRVYILGAFDKSISSEVIPDLLDLIDMEKMAKDPIIEVYINSHGGIASELLGLLSLFDMAKNGGIRIETYNIGYAYSCASMLALIGDKRYMSKYADNLPHLGQAFLDPKTVTQLERGAKHVSEWFSSIFDFYLKHTNLPKKQLEKILNDDDCHLNAEECLKYGFCDEII